MAIIIREYLGSPLGFNESNFSPFSLKESMNTLSTISKESVMVDIEGIHVGPTRNYTWYTEEALKGSIPTWTKPYERPLILHHNEKDGKIIGRVLNADYTDVNTRSKTGALIFTCNVADPEGKAGVKDGRLKTVSIGVLAHDVRCSICGHIISEHGECEHERGAVYDGETCYWMIYKMEAKELSYVIVPSDIYAHNLKIYSPTKEGNNIIENLEEGVLGVAKLKDLTESTETVIVEDANKKEAKKVTEPKEEGKAEKEETVDTLKETIAELEKVIKDLKAELEDVKKEAKEAKELKDVAEEELIAANTQLKEFAVEQVLLLREQLGRPAAIKEELMRRSKDSLMDTISDLKEETSAVTAKAVNLTESTGEVKESEEDEALIKTVEVTESIEEAGIEKLSEIEKPLVESLLDEGKDSSIKKEDEAEKSSGVDVKESSEPSNIDYEATLEMMSKYYNL